MATTNPDTWTTPSWHPDFGDAGVEMQYLRRFAKTMLKACPRAQISLEQPEEGYMYVRVMVQGSTTAEVYCVNGPSDSLRYGVFCFKDLQEKEAYCQTESEAVALIESLLASPVH